MFSKIKKLAFVIVALSFLMPTSAFAVQSINQLINSGYQSQAGLVISNGNPFSQLTVIGTSTLTIHGNIDTPIYIIDGGNGGQISQGSGGTMSLANNNGVIVSSNLTISGLSGGSTRCVTADINGLLGVSGSNCASGTVTNVTGSGNIASSGGTTPNLTFTGILPIVNGGTATSTFQNGGVVFYNSTLGTLSQGTSTQSFFYNPTTGNLGLGTSTPTAMLSLVGGDLLINGSNFVSGNTGVIPISGAGYRLMWSEFYSSFNAGRVQASTTAWDASNQGFYSAGFGRDCIHSGTGSFCAGDSAGAGAQVARGQGSAVFGSLTQALANYSLSAGTGCIVSAAAVASVCMGQSNTVSGVGSAGFGGSNTISGTNVLGFGSGITLSGNYGFGGGLGTSITGTAALGFGYKDTSMVLGSGATATLSAAGRGSIVGGIVAPFNDVNDNETFNATIRTLANNGQGAFAWGVASTTTGGATALLSSTGVGSFAFGYANNGTLSALGQASVSMGENTQCTNSNTFCFGKSFTNSSPSTFKVGWTATPTFTITATSTGIGTTSPMAAFSMLAASSTAPSSGIIHAIVGLENTVAKIFQAIDQWGDEIVSGDQPTLASCTGGSVSADSNNRAGAITIGTGLTSCGVVFAHAYPTGTVPHVFLNVDSGSVVGVDAQSVSTAGFTITSLSIIGSDVISYQVISTK